MLYIGMLAVDGGIDVFVENKGGTYLVLYKSRRRESYMYLALDGTLLASTFRNTLYNDLLVHEYLVRKDYILSKISESRV